MPLLLLTDHDKPEASLLRSAMAQPDLAQLLIQALADSLPRCMRNSPLCLAIPKDWPLPVLSNGAAAVALDHTIPLDHAATVCRRRRTCRAIISARHAVKYNESLLEKLLQIQQADVILVMADPRLQAYREAATVTTNNEIAGFRRLYADVVREDTCPPQWPHAAFIRKTAQSAFAENGLPTNYNAFLDRCRTQQLRVRSFRVAGQVLDLDQEPQLLQLTLHALTRRQPKSSSTLNGSVLVATTSGEDSNASYSSPRVAGPVLVGRNVEVAQDAILLGPVVICDGARIGTGATVDSAIVGPGQEIPANTIIRRQLLLNGHTPTSLCTLNSRWHREQTDRLRERYRTWPRWSYPALGKRAADIAVSSIALLFFAPVLPFIALAVKLTCPGPVFYRAKRQGRYGREFHCLKFRSMMTGADRLQQLLRKRNQVDGPQFKMENDPRVTRVGAFLRDTYLDEIPQFFNVLAGQMSIVGPRPSPEEENVHCPWWRDARLSVRPGVTGLWQLCRTRTVGQDFQEWIHYDTQYVQQLSAKTDLSICWKTAMQFAWRFLRKF